MSKFILCLDIDDCIYPSNNSYQGRLDDAHEVLKLNMKRIKLILEKYDMKVYITSSWFTILTLYADLSIGYTKAKEYELGDDFYKDEYTAFQIMKEVLDGYVVGMSHGDRYEDIARLLNEGLIVVALDDMDLNHSKIDVIGELKHNYLFVETTGFITNRHGYKIDKFMRTHNNSNGKRKV